MPGDDTLLGVWASASRRKVKVLHRDRDPETSGPWVQVGREGLLVDSQLKSGRIDILQAINLDNYPFPHAHHVPIAPGKTGDVLRVDMAIDSLFPNGRMIPGGATHNREQLSNGVAHLAGASTVPEARKGGAQLALLEHRLRYAASANCDLAMMGALPGGGSQRNAERHGFRIAYTRVKWRQTPKPPASRQPP